MIRKAGTKDSEEICAIASRDLGYGCTSGLVKARLEELDGNREAVFVAEEDGSVLGFVHVEKYSVLYAETMANILGLAVKEEARHRGTGKSLMEAAENWARERGMGIIRLNSGSSRVGAHEFYRKIGFVSEKDQKRFLKIIGGEDR